MCVIFFFHKLVRELFPVWSMLNYLVTLKLNSMQCNAQTPINIVYDPEILLGFFWSYI